ncbi:MAG TPA: THxN family PEP-CTERM protein [Rhodocyclaceae bacterium]|nr:THxN family PEP-CTERM protein [Zoogloeaceae bacterium]HRD34703.1 THxN family PEP-CTERM protein [Rhodocyclaceae bacterium]
MKKLNGLMAVALTGFACSAAQAAAVVEWGYTVETTWVASSFGAGTGTIIDHTDGAGLELSWGANVPLALGVERSGLVISDSPVDSATGGLFTNNLVPSPTATITHTNNSISSSFATLNTATLLTTLTLFEVDPDPAPDPGVLPLPPLSFAINFIETLNSTPCGFPSGSVCDDIFVIDNAAFDNAFTYKGITYYVSIVTPTGVIDPLPAASCLAAGAAVGCYGFQTRENAITPVSFGIVITTDPLLVSEPGALALAGLGLLGLGLVRRRKAV